MLLAHQIVLAVWKSDLVFATLMRALILARPTLAATVALALTTPLCFQCLVIVLD